MEIWAAIDLYKGRIVVPFKGGTSRARVWHQDPVSTSRRWAREGANGLHVIDLQAALGLGSNRRIVKSIVREAKIPLQFGGGIRKPVDATEWLRLGAKRVVIGTLAYREPSILEKIIKANGVERIVVAADYKNGVVMTEGWRRREKQRLIESVKNFEKMGVKTILVTTINLDGTGKGPDVPTLKRVREATGMKILASGGIRNIEDISKLQSVGIEGVILGRALYEGTVQLREINIREQKL